MQKPETKSSMIPPPPIPTSPPLSLSYVISQVPSPSINISPTVVHQHQPHSCSSASASPPFISSNPNTIHRHLLHHHPPFLPLSLPLYANLPTTPPSLCYSSPSYYSCILLNPSKNFCLQLIRVAKHANSEPKRLSSSHCYKYILPREGG